MGNANEVNDDVERWEGSNFSDEEEEGLEKVDATVGWL